MKGYTVFCDEPSSSVKIKKNFARFSTFISGFYNRPKVGLFTLNFVISRHTGTKHHYFHLR